MNAVPVLQRSPPLVFGPMPVVSHIHSPSWARRQAAVAGDERPRVVGVDGDVRVASPRLARPARGARSARTAPAGSSSTTDRLNGAARMTAVINPARPVVRIRIGRPVSRSQARNRPRRPARGSIGSGGGSSPYPPAGHSARRIVMMATSGHEDAELRLDDRREHREDRGPLRAGRATARAGRAAGTRRRTSRPGPTRRCRTS